ncbi:hypothetical protein M2451_003349 [Dysgonomonas sp. PFB1-18]|nr:hypothetical protein [Dysgonomonas sp. PF1-14]MDH6382009.1 hypothetical protein [Dysgonomonas sp. PFB1-18]MDH6399382.1 hypothetical protein [Dysgonomonas sp. PF1-23]
MGYLQENCQSAIYIFSFQVTGLNKRDGKKALNATIRRCSMFAESLQINFHHDLYLYLSDEKVSFVRLIFNIKESEDFILVKVPVLFTFATAIKLTFVNQEFFAK